MLDKWGIGVLSQSLARVSNTRFFFLFFYLKRANVRRK
jgi:hypothetical protein